MKKTVTLVLVVLAIGFLLLGLIFKDTMVFDHRGIINEQDVSYETVFHRIDSKIPNWDTHSKGGDTQISFVIYESQHKANFQKMFESLNIQNLDKKGFELSKISDFCQGHKVLLAPNQLPTFFVIKKGNKTIIAVVRVCPGGGLSIYLHDECSTIVWPRGIRFVIPA